MTRTRLIVAPLALVMAVGQLACAVHPDGEAAYRADPAQGVAVASVEQEAECDAQPASVLVSRQTPDLVVVAGAALHVPERVLHDADRNRSTRSGTRSPGIPVPLRL